MLLIKSINKNYPVLLVFLLWFIALVVINPVGEFPLNDDWAYSLAVKEWVETGVYHIIDWPAMSLFAQICWGALFSKIFGFSFTILRVSTLVLAALGGIAFWAILKRLKISTVYQSIALGLLMFNPLFFHLSNTFMTDVPFLSVCLIASYYYLRFIQEERVLWWVLALFFSICAILIRQLGLFVPLAFMVAIVLSFKHLRIQTIVLSIVSVLCTYASLKGYIIFLDSTTGLPTTFSQVESINNRLKPLYIYSAVIEYSGRYLVYLGLFLFPILINRFWAKGKWFYSLFGILLIVSIGFVVKVWNDVELGNTIYDLGLGVVTMPDVLKKATLLSSLPTWSIVGLKILALISVLTLSGHLTKGISRLRVFLIQSVSKEQIFKLGILFFTLAYALFLIIDFYHFDRYILPLIPVLLILILPTEKRIKRNTAIGSWVLLLILMFYSIAGTYDYLEWNKVRWQALSFLESEGISADKIDGGFEYNGWHQTHHRNPSNRFAKSWWFVDEDDYSVAFQPYQNYSVMKAFPCDLLLNKSIDTIYALQRPDWNQVDDFFYDMELTNQNSRKNDFFNSSTLLGSVGKDSLAYSGKHVFNMKTEDVYALSHTIYPVKAYDQLSISMYIKGDKNSFGVVNQAPDAQAFYYCHTPFQVVEKEEGWKYITAEMRIPANYPSDTLQLYLWKQQPKALQIEDFRITWKQY